MNKNIVVVDIDDTIHEYSHTLALVALNEFGVRINTEPLEWKDALIPVTDWGLGTKIFQRCHDRDYIFLTNPYPGSVEALLTLHDMGYEVCYYTDRKASSYEDTKEWLGLHGFPNIDGLKCCKDKRFDLLKIKDNLVTIVDDRPRTLQFVQQEIGCKDVFAIKHSTNQNLSDMVGIHVLEDWYKILDKFMEVIGTSE